MARSKNLLEPESPPTPEDLGRHLADAERRVAVVAWRLRGAGVRLRPVRRALDALRGALLDHAPDVPSMIFSGHCPLADDPGPLTDADRAGVLDLLDEAREAVGRVAVGIGIAEVATVAVTAREALAELGRALAPTAGDAMHAA